MRALRASLGLENLQPKPLAKALPPLAPSFKFKAGFQSTRLGENELVGSSSAAAQEGEAAAAAEGGASLSLSLSLSAPHALLLHPAGLAGLQSLY